MHQKQMKLSQSKISFIDSINLNETINSGQVFLWEKKEESWYGINGQDVIEISENPFKIKSLNNNIEKFFRFDDNIEEIFQSISKDKIVKNALKRFRGLRLLRQDPFQCYITFIVSSNSNIQNIRNCLKKICINFGKKTEFQKNEFYLFPTAEILSKISISDLLKCGLGYRAKYVKKASQDVVNDKIDFEYLKNVDYHTAKAKLLESFGIGNKVADCILLFSLEKLDSFPLDTWMMKILKKYYFEKIPFDGKTLTPKKYDELHEEIVKYFGPYAGYAQQFLFKMERENFQKKWL